MDSYVIKCSLIILLIILVGLSKNHFINLFNYGSWDKPEAEISIPIDKLDDDLNQYKDYYTFLNRLSFKDYVEYVELSNGISFYVGLDNYLYYTVNNDSVGTVIEGLNRRGIKTLFGDIYRLFYCESIGIKKQEMVYALTGSGHLYHITSSLIRKSNFNKPNRLNYKRIVDVYSKDDGGFVENYAVDINGNHYPLSLDELVVYKKD